MMVIRIEVDDYDDDYVDDDVDDDDDDHPGTA